MIVIDNIKNKVDDYRAMEDMIIGIDAVEAIVNTEFAAELEQIKEMQQRIEARSKELLKERGINLSKKEYQDVQKGIRQDLVWPMTLLMASGHSAISGKTCTMDGFTVTLVDQGIKLVENPELDEEGFIKAHREDVQLLSAAEMYSSLEIKANKDTLAWMELREKNMLPTLTSLIAEQSRYCKVKLHEKEEK